MIEYQGYLILGTALMIHPNSPDWRSLGIVCSKTPEGFIVQVEHIGGPVFTTKGSAERHGKELCQQWVDEALPARSSLSSSAIVRSPV